jgi:metallo-beta-lactamase class B
VRFLKTAQQALEWNEPAAPTKIVGPIYFVGTKGLAAYPHRDSAGGTFC